MLPATPSSSNWYEIERRLADEIRKVHEITEENATAQLDYWIDELMQKVDDKFLNWYFSYVNQKAMEFGVPFAWATFKLDSVLKIWRNEDEKELNAGEIIQKRMIKDFNKKFIQLVLNDSSEQSLKRIVESVGRTYTSAMAVKFSQIQSCYKVNNQDWDEHLRKVSQLVYDTGNSRSTLDISSFNSNFLTEVLAVTTATVSLKLAANFAAKAGFLATFGDLG